MFPEKQPISPQPGVVGKKVEQTRSLISHAACQSQRIGARMGRNNGYALRAADEHNQEPANNYVVDSPGHGRQEVSVASKSIATCRQCSFKLMWFLKRDSSALVLSFVKYGIHRRHASRGFRSHALSIAPCIPPECCEKLLSIEGPGQ